MQHTPVFLRWPLNENLHSPHYKVHKLFSKLFASSTVMDKFQFHNITHLNIQWLRKYSLHHSQTLRHTLNNNEFIDNVLVAITLFVLVILLKDIIITVVYARPRFSVARDTITYFS